MSAKYAKTSPWHLTNFNGGNYLDIMKKRRVTSQPDDILWEITPQYTHRPDLLAFDLYSTSKLWWVFAARNIDIIRDPVFDFVPGTKIYLPKKSSLDNLLG